MEIRNLSKIDDATTEEKTSVVEDEKQDSLGWGWGQ